MRPFEIALLTLNALALLLCGRNRSLRVESVTIGLNLLVFVLHVLLEGLRYQMAFSYLVLLLLLIYLSAKAIGTPRQIRFPKVFTVMSKIVMLVMLGFSCLLIYAFPVFTLPAPTGSAAVGVAYLALTDETQPDPFLRTGTQPRAVMVKLYYPAIPDPSKPFLPYFHGSTRLLRAFAGFYQMPRFLFDHLRLVKTHAKAELAPATQEQSYPVILFSHGAGTTVEVATSQSEDLASHGYIVVAIDHPYVSAATDFPDRIVTARDATTNFDTPEPAKPITQIMADDDAFVIVALGKINEGQWLPLLQGKLNLDQIGVIGHSVGGAVAYNMAINDRRVKAAIDLDGVVYVAPAATTAVAPFLMLANDRYHLQAIVNRESLMEKFDATPEGQQALVNIYGSAKVYVAAYAEAQHNLSRLADLLQQSGTLYTITGCDHMKFTDIGLFIGSAWLREVLQIAGNTEPVRCLTITQALTVAFFDQQLKSQGTATLLSLPGHYPELQNIAVK